MPGSNCEIWRRICEITWYSAGPVITLRGRITAGEYLDISGNQVYPMVQMSFPNNDAVFKMTVRPHIQKGSVSVWGPWRYTSTSSLASTMSDLNNSEPLWPVADSTVISTVPPPSSLRQPEDVLHRQRYSIPLQNVQNLYQSTARRTQAVLQANGGPTP